MCKNGVHLSEENKYQNDHYKFLLGHTVVNVKRYSCKTSQKKLLKGKTPAQSVRILKEIIISK